MSITILGHHIRLIRPQRIIQPIIFKSDLPKAKYNKRPKTIKVNLDWVKDSITMPPEPSCWER